MKNTNPGPQREIQRIKTMEINEVDRNEEWAVISFFWGYSETVKCEDDEKERELHARTEDEETEGQTRVYDIQTQYNYNHSLSSSIFPSLEYSLIFHFIGETNGVETPPF